MKETIIVKVIYLFLFDSYDYEVVVLFDLTDDFDLLDTYELKLVSDNDLFIKYMS